MESQSIDDRHMLVGEDVEDDSSDAEEPSQDVMVSRTLHPWMRSLKQRDSQTAAALLLLRQHQIALGDMITGPCLNCITADVEDDTESGDEDLSDLLNKRKITVTDYANRQHLLRPMRTATERSMRTRVRKHFPLTELFTQTRWHDMLSDAIAGATVAVMGVPESLAYAEIAGLPHVYGLYALVMPQLVYSFLGMSRKLMVGPVAMISLLLQEGLEGSMDQYQCPLWHNQTHSEVERQRHVCQEKYVDLAILQSLLCGCFLTLFCVLQLGFLLKFLGHPVISGFSSGSAIVIMLHQLKNFVGYEVASSEFPILKMWAYASKASEVQPMTLGLGLLFTICLIGLRKIGIKCGCKLLGSLGPLLSCVIGVLCIYFCKPLQHIEGLEIIGDIPGGSLPSFLSVFSRWTWQDVRGSLPLSATIALIGFLEAFATAQSLAKQQGEELSSSQELLALGFSNIFGSMCSSYPASGSFSRSAVCSSSGGVSQLSGLVAVALSLMALLYLTQLFYYLPKFVLAAIVVSSVSKLIACDVARSLFHVKKSDFAMWMAAFIGTLCLGPLLGIGVAVLLSLSVVIYESVHPPITVLWRMDGTNSYRPIQHNPGGIFVEGVFIVRIGATMYFANVAYVEETLRTLIADMDAISEVKYLVLDFTPVTTADFSAVEALSDVVENFRERGVQVAFSCVGPRLEGVFERFGLLESLREEWCFTTVHEAVLHCACHSGADLPSLEQELETAVKELETKVSELSLAQDRVERLRRYTSDGSVVTKQPTAKR